MTLASIPANARWRATKLDHFSQEGGSLRGHGDSQWVPGGSYYLVDFVYDLVQLVRRTRLTGLTIIAHLLGGSIAGSWAPDPEADGSARHFQDARVASIPGAGHWPHHDRFDLFMPRVRAFLGA